MTWSYSLVQGLSLTGLCLCLAAHHDSSFETVSKPTLDFVAVCCLCASPQERLPPILSKLSPSIAGGSSSKASPSRRSSSSGEQLFNREQLALYVGGKPPNKEQIYIAILGQVFDVSRAPQFYSE